MMTKYDIALDDDAVYSELYRVGNQIFKLLPLREEERDWQRPLDTVALEMLGMSSLFPGQRDLVALVCKLEGLKAGGDSIDFYSYRRAIFECCSLVDRLKELCHSTLSTRG